MIEITLKDGSKMQVEEGSSILDVAKHDKPGIGNESFIGRSRR